MSSTAARMFRVMVNTKSEPGAVATGLFETFAIQQFSRSLPLPVLTLFVLHSTLFLSLVHYG